MKNFSNEFINLIKTKMPSESNAAEFIRGIIPMSKESAYRRLRGEIEFSLNEAIAVADKLDLSIDSITKKADSKNIYELQMFHIRKDFLFEDYYTLLENLTNLNNLLRQKTEYQITSVNNELPIRYFLKYNLISKLRQFKWIYQRNNHSKPVKMAEFTIPQRINYIERMLLKELEQSRITFILDKKIIETFMRDIKYFIQLELISQTEVKQLKEEIHSLLNDMEYDCVSGINNPIPCSFYVSNMYINSYYILWKNNDRQHVTIRPFGVNFFSIKSPEIIAEFENWTSMLIKASTSISFSAEKQRIDFFQQQRQIIDSI